MQLHLHLRDSQVPGDGLLGGRTHFRVCFLPRWPAKGFTQGLTEKHLGSFKVLIDNGKDGQTIPMGSSRRRWDCLSLELCKIGRWDGRGRMGFWGWRWEFGCDIDICGGCQSPPACPSNRPSLPTTSHSCAAVGQQHAGPIKQDDIAHPPLRALGCHWRWAVRLGHRQPQAGAFSFLSFFSLGREGLELGPQCRAG